MRRTEIAGFWTESYEILQAMATETSGFTRWINHFTVVQAELPKGRRPPPTIPLDDTVPEWMINKSPRRILWWSGR